MSVRGAEMESQKLRSCFRGVLALATAVLVVVGSAASASAARNAYSVTNLVSGQALDADLVNAWGLTSLPGSPWWVADNGTKRPLKVQVPNAPTGAVSNTESRFVVSNGTSSGPAVFIFATEEGKILGWNPNVSMTQAQVAVDESSLGAVYKGLAIASTTTDSFLYATDFHNRRVDVFNGSFEPANAPGAFVDPKIPAGYAPFGIQNVEGTIVVT